MVSVPAAGATAVARNVMTAASSAAAPALEATTSAAATANAQCRKRHPVLLIGPLCGSLRECCHSLCPPHGGPRRAQRA